MNIHELKKHDPVRFQREYQQWAEYDASDYDWWVCVEEDFKERMKSLRVEVDRIQFSLGYCQSDYATFEGKVFFYRWLENNGYAESHLALYLDAKRSCHYFEVRPVSYHRRGRVNLDYITGITEPQGVFADLPEEDWDALVEDQFASEDWEQLAQDWVDDIEHDLYRELQQEYEYLTSEEQFIEHCEANEITFTTDEE